MSNPSLPGGLGALPYVLPIAILALVLFRSARPRILVIERLWVAPALIMTAASLLIFAQGAMSLTGLLLQIVAVLVGAGLGWWRGRLTHLEIDPKTHTLTSKVSPVGLALLGAVFLTRLGLRAVAMSHPAVFHASVGELTDAMLLLAVGLVCAQRLEVWIRARQMLADARGC
ncbi:CcdC protein domain-containing protein [Phenylobacterium aquaticum]|uniref:CcdC protein domain-containing protein n=1 Tax=Phenylobacterium aquaticum TaxID=1763816 RepID=UPI0026F16122|nr:CcdC protein domain-containing protein [Phenylobacterium aquaticum]